MDSDRLLWEDLGNRRISVPEHVVFRALAAETILLNVQTGRYHGLDAIGARFFTALQESASVGDACATLAEEYEQPDVRIQRDMTGFCDTLQRLGLIAVE